MLAVRIKDYFKYLQVYQNMFVRIGGFIIEINKIFGTVPRPRAFRAIILQTLGL